VPGEITPSASNGQNFHAGAKALVLTNHWLFCFSLPSINRVSRDARLTTHESLRIYIYIYMKCVLVVSINNAAFYQDASFRDIDAEAFARRARKA